LVNPVPEVSFAAIEDQCINSPAYKFTQSTGTHSGDGVLNNMFHPDIAGVGTHTLLYTFTDPVTGCKASQTREVYVHALPVVDFEANKTVCINAGSVDLTTMVDLQGGVFGGRGVNVSTFDPIEVGAGNTAVTYTYTDANSCVNVFTSVIKVNPQPVITVAQNKVQVCEGAAAILSLKATEIGTSYTLRSGLTEITHQGNGGVVEFEVANPTNSFFDVIATNAYTCETILPNAIEVVVNQRPVADAGTDRTVLFGAEVTLDARNSTGTDLRFAWKPEAMFADPTLAVQHPRSLRLQ
jgi:hypothetical protein